MCGQLKYKQTLKQAHKMHVAEQERACSWASNRAGQQYGSEECDQYGLYSGFIMND